jgi:hypothetical protein
MTPAPDWLLGSPMDPDATPVEKLPALPGVPFVHEGAGALISGPTGAGRSSLAQAALYDTMAYLRCAYLGSEVTEDEFNARAANLALLRGDEVNGELRSRCSQVRYLDLPSVVGQAWADPAAWIEGVLASYDLLVIDPLSSVASTLGLDFDTSNAEYVSFYDRLVQPLVSLGIAVLLIDNIGHAEEAKTRAKGVSAKQDRADLVYSCARCANPPGLLVKADKVRSVRAPQRRGDEWLFDRDTQRIERRGHVDPGDDATSTAFRPTIIMEKVSRLVEQEPGLSKRQIRTAIGGKAANVDLALGYLIAEGFLALSEDGQTHHHHSVRPYREADDRATASTESRPCPDRVPDSVKTTASTASPALTEAGTRDAVLTPGLDCQPRPNGPPPASDPYRLGAGAAGASEYAVRFGEDQRARRWR